MKSTSACNLMAVQGLKSRVRAPSSTAHLEMRPVRPNCGGSLPIRQWEVGDHKDVVCDEIMVKLPGGDEYTIK
jgi:hypothetical protein